MTQTERTMDEKQAAFTAMNPLVNALFDRSEDLVEQSGVFMPFGAALIGEDLRLLEVEPSEGEQMTNPKALLPVIQDALKGQGGEDGCIAIGTAELVMLEENSQNAIKVYAEDRTGFAMAFYLPMDMTGPGQFDFGEVRQVGSDTVIGGWGDAG